MSNLPLATSNPQFSDPLLNRFFMSPAEKADKEKGKGIMQAFYRTQTSNSSSLNFFKLRNARWIELLLWCKGSQPMKEFLSYMNVSDANKAWLNIDMEQSRLAAQFVGTIIESMAKNKIYPCVTAIDDGSLNEKEQRLYDALYRMHEVQTINAVQQATGINVEPPNAYVPDNELAAQVYFELQDRLPKEIRFEKMLAKLQSDINFEKIANRKTLFYTTVLNFASTKIERVSPGEYTVRQCIPPNMVYNFFVNDIGENEVDMIGEFINIKVKDFRRLFGKSASNPDGLDEKDIFDLAKMSTNKNIGTFNYMWDQNWAMTTYNLTRPYDDNSVLVLDAEINCGEDVYYVEKSDSFGRMNIEQKKGIPYQQKTKDGTIIEQPKPDDVEIIKRQKNSWMRGVYAPYGDKMLYWGKPDIIISAYTDTAKPLSSYTVVIPNNDGEYVPSLFERIIEPLREYQLTKLQRKKLISQVRASGIRIDIENARNIDLGNGNTIAWEELLRIYLNTGVEIYSSKGLDPLQRESPALGNTIHDESIEKILGLTNVLTGIANEIRQLIGVPTYRDGADVSDRTAAALAEGQNKSSYNVTDYVLDYNNQLWETTFYKVCLLHWNDIVKKEPESKEDMLNTRFDVAIKMKITEYEKQIIENDIQRYSQMPDKDGNPLLSPKDAIMIREIDNYKLSCLYLDATLEKNRQKAIDDSARLQEQNAQVQQQSAAQTAQQDAQLQQQKAAFDAQQKEMELRRAEKLALLNIIGTMRDTALTKGVDIPDAWKGVEAQMIQNVIMPVIQENVDMKQALYGPPQQDQGQSQPQDQQMSQGQPQPGQAPPNQPPIPQQ